MYIVVLQVHAQLVREVVVVTVLHLGFRLAAKSETCSSSQHANYQHPCRRTILSRYLII